MRSIAGKENIGVSASLVLFLVAVLGTEFWVRLPRPSRVAPIYLGARTKIPGYHFQPVLLGAAVSANLDTTNLINGHFFDARSNRVSVFSAEWEPGRGTGAEVFGHTPEICWIGTGFQTLQLGQPDEVNLKFGDRIITFKCRVLKHPDLPFPEVAVWAACIGGQWVGLKFSPPSDKETNMESLTDHLKRAKRHFAYRWEEIQRLNRHPFTINARKQFIRFSLPLEKDFQTAICNLEMFADLWLQTVEPRKDLSLHSAFQK